MRNYKESNDERNPEFSHEERLSYLAHTSLEKDISLLRTEELHCTTPS